MEITEPRKKLLTAPKLTLGIGGGLGIWGFIDPETVLKLLGAAWREELTKMLIAFVLAGLVHRFIFRKDIENQLTKIVGPIVDALNNIADTAQKHADQTEKRFVQVEARTDQNEQRFLRVENRIERLEKGGKP